MFDVLKSTKLQILDDKAVKFKGVQIVGISFVQDRHYLKTALKKFNITQPSILLYHNPEGLQYASEAGISLQLSGHTHNGQIFPFTGIVKIAFPKIKGLYDIDGMKLFVSQGTGTWGPPMRLGSVNEIAVLRLVPA